MDEGLGKPRFAQINIGARAYWLIPAIAPTSRQATAYHCMSANGQYVTDAIAQECRASNARRKTGLLAQIICRARPQSGKGAAAPVPGWAIARVSKYVDHGPIRSVC
jgi:hypothetical protein